MRTCSAAAAQLILHSKALPAVARKQVRVLLHGTFPSREEDKTRGAPAS